MTDCCLCVCWRPKTHRRLIADIFQSARLAKRDPKIIPSKSKIDKLASYLAIYPAQLSTVTYELNQMLAKSHRKGHIGYVILTIEVYRSILKKFTEHSIAYLLETSLNVVLHDILLIQDLFYIRSAALLIKECSKSEVFTTNLTFVWALLDLSSLIYQAEAKGPTIPFGSLELHSLDEEKTSLCFVGLTILTSLMPKISQHATWLSTFLPSIIDIVLNILSISNLTHNTMDAKHPQHPLHILEEEDLAEVFQQMPDFVTALTNANPNNLLDMAWTLLRSMAITNTTTVIEEITHCIIQTMLKYKMKFCCKLSIQVLFLVPYTFAQHNTDLDLNLFLEAHVFTILTKHLYYSISLHNQVEKVQQYHFLLDGSEAFYQHREVKLGALIDMSMWMEKHIDVIYASATYPIDHRHIMDCFQSILQILIYVFKVHPKVCNALPKQIQALVYDAMGQSPLFTQTFEAFAQTASAYMPSEDKVKEENKQKVLEKRLLRQQQRREQQAQEEAPLAIEGEEGNEQEEGVKEERKEVEEEDDVAEQIEDEQATLLLNKLLLILCKLSEKTKPFGGSIFTILTKLFEDINLVAQQHFVEYVAPSLHPQQHGMQGTSLSSLTASNTSNSPGDKKHDRDGGNAANPVKIGVVNTVRKNHLLQHYFICSHYMMSIIVSRMVIDHKAVLLTNTSPPALLSNETWNYLMNMLKSFSHFEGRRGILHLLGILLAVSQPLILQSHHHQHAGNGYHNHAAQQGGAVYELELYKQLLMPQASSSKVRQRVANYFFYPFSAHQMHALYSTMFEDVLHMKSLFGLRVMQWWNLMVIILQSFGDQAVLTSLPVFVTMLSRIEHAESIADTFDEMTAVRIQYWKVFVLSYLNVIARMYYIDDLEYLIKQYYQKLNTCEDLELNLEDDILRWKEVVPTPASDEVEEEKANEITEDEAVFVANPAFATRTKPPSASSSRPTANATAESHSTEPNKDVVKLSINDIKRKLMTCHIFQAYSFEINKAFEMEFIPFDASHSMLRDTMVLVAHGEDSQFASLDQFKPTSRTLFGDEHDHHSETGSVVSRGSNASSRVSKRSRTSSKSNKTKVNLPNHHHHHNLKHNYTEGYTILSSKLMTDSSCLDDVSTSIATEKTADSTQASNGNNSLLYPVLPPHIRTHAWRETFFRTNAHIHQRLEHVPPEQHFNIVTEEFVHLLNELSAE